MIKKKEDVKVQTLENTGIFSGKLYKNFILSSEEMGGRLKFFNKIELTEGSMITDHAHIDDAEIYYILEGEVTVTDNENTAVLKPGDVVFTGDGNRHSIKNTGKGIATFMAVIMENK